MGILGTILTDTIVDGGSGVNVLPEEMWRKFGKPTLWPSMFNLLGVDQQGIKPLGTLVAQQVTIRMQPFVLDFVVIPLKKKGYDAILGRGWLVVAKVNHNWKKNTLTMESGGRKFAIDLRTQMVSEVMASSLESESDGEHRRDEGRMNPNNEGVLELEECSEDETSSLNGLFHWQMDYELHTYMLGVEELEDEEVFPPQFVEYKEGDAEINESPAHSFEGKEIRYEEPSVEVTNLGDAENPRNILVGDD